MSIVMPQGFNIISTDVIDSRLVLTYEQMMAIRDGKDGGVFPDHYFALCSDDNKFYFYDSKNRKLDKIGKFREVSPTKLSQLINDADFITKAEAVDIADTKLDKVYETSGKTKISTITNNELGAYLNFTNTKDGVGAFMGVPNNEASDVRVALESYDLSDETKSIRLDLYDDKLVYTKNKPAGEYTDGDEVATVSVVDTITEAFTSHLSDFDNPHNVTREQLNVENVDNTSDLDKPISNATQVALDSKVTAIKGKGLSTNDFTNEYSKKLNELKDIRSIAGNLSYDEGSKTLSSTPLSAGDTSVYVIDNTVKARISPSTSNALKLTDTGLMVDKSILDSSVSDVKVDGLSIKDKTTNVANIITSSLATPGLVTAVGEAISISPENPVQAQINNIKKVMPADVSESNVLVSKAELTALVNRLNELETKVNKSIIWK